MPNMTSNPDLLPIEWSREVIAQMAETSAVLGLSRRRIMSTRHQVLPASALLAQAFFLGQTTNDFTDQKQPTNAEWDGVDLVVAELAALVAIPHAYEQDNAFPVWDETRPQIVEAMSARLDGAVLFGASKPAQWGQSSIVEGAIAAGQTVVAGTGDDIAQDIAASAAQLKQRGFRTNGFATEPGFGWNLVGMRSADGVPIYQENLSGPVSTGLYGFPMIEVSNGAWDSTEALVVHGDWQKSIVGIRQDITFTRHESGVLTDGAGLVTFNATEQDSTIWRAVMRVAWARANPATRLGPDPDQTGDRPDPESPTKFPFAAITPPGP